MKAVCNVLTSCIKLCNVYDKFQGTNQSAHLQKLANQSKLNGALVIELINSSFNKTKKNFDSLIKWGRIHSNKKERKKEKKKVWAVKKDFRINLAKYVNYSELRKNSKVVNV